MIRRFAVFAALAAALAGCITVGRPFRLGKGAPDIQVGKTTRDDVRKMFGDPARTGLDDGDETWTYMDYKISLFANNHTEDMLVRFDKDGKVRSYSFNTDSETK